MTGNVVTFHLAAAKYAKFLYNASISSAYHGFCHLLTVNF